MYQRCRVDIICGISNLVEVRLLTTHDRERPSAVKYSEREILLCTMLDWQCIVTVLTVFYSCLCFFNFLIFPCYSAKEIVPGAYMYEEITVYMYIRLVFRTVLAVPRGLNVCLQATRKT